MSLCRDVVHVQEEGTADDLDIALVKRSESVEEEEEVQHEADGFAFGFGFVYFAIFFMPQSSFPSRFHASHQHAPPPPGARRPLHTSN